MMITPGERRSLSPPLPRPRGRGGETLAPIDYSPVPEKTRRARMMRLICCLVRIAGPAAAAPTEIQKDIVFGKGGDVELKLDLAMPEGDGPFPAVVCIHGGAWQVGHRGHHHPTV